MCTECAHYEHKRAQCGDSAVHRPCTRAKNAQCAHTCARIRFMTSKSCSFGTCSLRPFFKVLRSGPPSAHYASRACPQLGTTGPAALSLSFHFGYGVITSAQLSRYGPVPFGLLRFTFPSLSSATFLEPRRAPRALSRTFFFVISESFLDDFLRQVQSLYSAR